MTTYLTNFHINDGGGLSDRKDVNEIIRDGVMRTRLQVSERQACINLEASDTIFGNVKIPKFSLNL